MKKKIKIQLKSSSRRNKCLKSWIWYLLLTETNNLEKLNLTICEGSKIPIIIPVEINDDLDKFNTSSGYYNDIYYTTTSEDGTDISLNNRKTKYIKSDKILCQEGCSFLEYDYNNIIANCSCEEKESLLSIADMYINKDKLT